VNFTVIIFTNSIVPWSWGFQNLLRQYGVVTRVMQRWSLFCPEPRRFDKSYYFVVTFKDGTKTTWRRPYPPNWDFWERWNAYNWQKFDLAGFSLDNENLWPDVSEWMKRKFWSDTNPPAQVDLFVLIIPVLPPQTSGYVQHESSERQVQTHHLFTYLVAEKRIQQ
jgi:hypothetical protein